MTPASWTETVEGFVRRTGPVAVDAVARRFGWEPGRARIELVRLEREGFLAAEVTKCR